MQRNEKIDEISHFTDFINRLKISNKADKRTIVFADGGGGGENHFQNGPSDMGKDFFSVPSEFLT